LSLRYSPPDVIIIYNKKEAPGAIQRIESDERYGSEVDKGLKINSDISY
jgi:hypothetical protein